MNKLTSSIFRTLYFENANKNFVFSPASYLEAVNLLSLCLKNDNLQELLDALEITKDQLAEYVKTFKESVGQSLENYNCFLSSTEYVRGLNPEIVEQLKSLNTELKTFDNLNLNQLVLEINKLAAEKTHDKIQNLISRGQLNDLVSFIILNCVYFKKEWLYKFTESYVAEKFFGAQKQVDIKFLRNYEPASKLPFYEDETLDIVELSYKNSDVCCYILVPKNNLFELTNKIEETYSKIKLVNSPDNTQVIVLAPAFKIESEFNLEKSTQIAGVKKIFDYTKDWNLVDWDKLKPEAVIKVDKIIQKAFIDFTKDGTEAAAATYISMCSSGCYGGPIKTPRIKIIRADKPFIYILASKKNLDIPLFIGVVNQVENSIESPNQTTWSSPFLDLGLKGESYTFNIDGVNGPLTGMRFTSRVENVKTE